MQEAAIDCGGNCGNMSSAVGPFTVEEGLVARPHDGEAVVRVHDTNTAKIIVSRFPVVAGALAAEADLAIDGVEGRTAPIRLEFVDPGVPGRAGCCRPAGRVTRSRSRASRDRSERFAACVESAISI